MVYDFGDTPLTWQDGRDLLGRAAYAFYWVYAAWWVSCQFFRTSRRAIRRLMQVHFVAVPVAW